MTSTESRSTTLLALSCVGFLASAPALAQEASPAVANGEGGSVELKGVTVTDSAIDDATGYHAQPAASPKFTAPLIDTPRSVVVLGEQVIKDSGSTTLADALRTVPGITFGAAEGGNPIGDRPFIRGFDSEGSTFLDGVRDIAAQTREVFDVEQVQVIRGSDSSMGGRGSAGGAINIISKLPTDQRFVHVDGSLGTADYKRATLDLSQPLSPTVAVRLAAMWHDQDVAGRDAIWQRRWGVAPSVTVGLGTPTRITAAYYHLHSNELPDSGLPYTYVCSASVCNAPAGTILDEPVHDVTTLGGQTGTVSPDAFYGLKDRDFRRTHDDAATLRVEHDFSRDVTLRNTLRYDHSWQGYSYMLPDDSQANVVGTTATNATAASVTRYTDGGYVWRRANTRQGYVDTLIDQLDLTAKFKTGILTHSFATGLEWSYEKARRGSYVMATGSTISPRCTSDTLARYYCASLFDPNPNDPWINYASDTSTMPAAIVKSPSYGDTINRGWTGAAYAFDSIGIGDQVILNLGLRYDHFTSKLSPGVASAATSRTSLKRTDDVWTWQAGLVFKPSDDTSLYASYATAATPPNSLLGEGREGNAIAATTLDDLKVERSRTIEAGARADLLDEQLSLTLDIFRTETRNARVQIDADTIGFIGKQRAQGVEIGFNGRITPQWSLFGGYSYLDATIRNGGMSALTAAAVGLQPARTVYVPSVNNGLQAPNTAKHNFTVWTNYQATRRLSIGGGVFYASRVFGGYADNRRAVQDGAGIITIIPATTVIERSVPSYWRFDARVGYKINDTASISVNIQNLTNKRYFSQAYASHYATMAPCRSAFATLSLSL